MAHFRAVIKGQRGEASRLGSKTSGIRARVQSWGYDILIDATHCSEEAAKRDKTLGAGDWVTIELVEHNCNRGYGKLIARVNLTTGEII